MSARRPLGILRKHPNLFLLWAGQILSQAGSKMYSISLAWWFLEALPDRAGTWIGALLLLTSLPGILFVKKIGSTIDRSDTKNMLRTADLFAGLACLLPVFFVTNVPLFSVIVCGVAFILSTCQAVLDPALLRGIAYVVPPEDQELATGLISSTFSVAGFLGALLGAGAIAAVGVKGSIWLNAASYFLAFVLTSFTRFSGTVVAGPEHGNSLAAVAENLSDFFTSRPLLKRLLYVFGFINFFSTPILILIPIYAKRILLVGARELAFFEAALWAGMLLGSLSLSLWKFVRDPLLLGALMISFFGLSLLGPAFHSAFGLYLVGLFFSGYFMGVNNVRFLSLFQEKVPVAIQGSFFARLTALCSFMMPIAFLTYGFLADQFPVKVLMLSQGVGVLLVSSPLWRASRRGVTL